MNQKINHLKKYSLSVETEQYVQSIPVNIQPSIIIDSLCASEDCTTLSGTVINNLSNVLKISTFKIKPVTIKYLITTPYESYEYLHEFNSPVNNDWLDNVVFKNIPEENSHYIANINIKAYETDLLFAENNLIVKVVRPIQIKHFGKYELAETYEPVPVTGCIPGSVGNSVQYSESSSETRQNSVSITLNKNWSDSFSTNETQSNSEGISVGETNSTINTSSLSKSETQSESFTDTDSQGESNNVTFNTTEGENWSWTLGETNTNAESQSQSQNTNTSVNGSTTVGVSGEGSLPFLAKASGKVEVSAGISRGWGESNNNTTSNSNSESRGYTTAGSSQNGRSYGSIQNDSRSHSLSGSYVLSSNTSNSVSESSSLSSGRVWNMSESFSSGKIVSVGNSESIAQTIVNSITSSTTFSYGGYIPRGRFGIFFRQTSRYVKLSEIITYDMNGFASHAGFIMMNTWAWAPELSISNTCEDAMVSSLPIAECLIPPCGE